ncbi:MAG: hypothetical protein AAFQ94_29340 [Bacteroidota bacterium]
MKSVSLAIVVMLCFLFSCKEGEQTAEFNEQPVNQTEGLSASTFKGIKKLTKKSFAIGDSLHLTDLNNFKYFGSFFKDRAIYYHNYEDTIYHGKDIKGSNLLLCFFDQHIARMKYQVDRDLTSELMRKYGSFRIKPLDSLSVVAVKSGNILDKSEGTISLHEDIKNYELTWLKPDRQIVFRRSENFESTRLFTYEERIPDYKESMIYLTRY